MTQIEQLEKTIDINEIAKNGNVKKLVRDGERKDARIQDLEEALKRQKTETEATKVDLIDEIIKIISICHQDQDQNQHYYHILNHC